MECSLAHSWAGHQQLSLATLVAKSGLVSRVVFEQQYINIWWILLWVPTKVLTVFVFSVNVFEWVDGMLHYDDDDLENKMLLHSEGQ